MTAASAPCSAAASAPASSTALVALDGPPMAAAERSLCRAVREKRGGGSWVGVGGSGSRCKQKGLPLSLCGGGRREGGGRFQACSLGKRSLIDSDSISDDEEGCHHQGAAQTCLDAPSFSCTRSIDLGGA